ncbi:MAG: hypothetical protein IT537_05505 [Hyphomicrobiales bacterium]|nr:hypothetical protein [Hyphomicrobiales bacterium]
MSGPKVFHVVTREEIIAICEGHLARLDAAIDGWKKAGGRSGATKEDVDAVSARRDALRRMLTDERFAELQKQAPAEISFLRSDAERRVERASAAAVEARQMLRRTARTARMLLEALDKQRVAVPDELRAKLQSATAASELDHAVSIAFALLAQDPVSTGVTERQRELAERLGRGEKRATLSEWLASQLGQADDGNSLKIDRHLVALSELGIDTSSFEVRAAAIANDSSSRRTLLADSLLLDLARTVKEGRERVAVLAELREGNVELSRFSSEAAQILRAEIDRAVAIGDTGSAPDLIQRVNALVAAEIRQMAAVARRRAVLQGLASLGYEVTEGMATAWVEGGRVVLRKAANRDYGVELAGGTKSDRLQVRAVGFGNPGGARDPSRDRDMETIWCDEFTRLQVLVSAKGGKIEIENALPVGAVPIKVIEDTMFSGQDAGDLQVPARQNVLR